MFRKRHLLLFIFLFLSITVFGHNVFEKIYGKNKFEDGRSVLELSDGSIVMAGTTTSFSGDKDFYLVKTDSLGNLLWEKNYGDTLDEIAHQFVATQDGGFIIVGETNSVGLGGFDMYVVRVNSMGDSIWSNTYGGAVDECGNAIISLSDGGFIIAGQSKTIGFAPENVYLVRIDSLGVQVRDTFYGAANKQTSVAITQTYDGGFAIVGHTDDLGAGRFDIWVIKTDSNLVLQWDSVFGMADNDLGTSVLEAPDSSLYVLGFTQITTDSSRITLIKFDKTGNLLWVKYPQSKNGDRAYHMLNDYNGGLVLVGYTSDTGKGSEVLFMRVDDNGVLKNSAQFGGTANDLGFALSLAYDSGYILVGQTEGFGVYDDQLYLIKTDSLGVIECAGALSFLSSDTNVCINTQIDFTNTTISSDGYTWKINQVMQSMDLHFQYFFDSVGTFEVQLINCTDTLNQTVTVLPDPVVSFSCQVDTNDLTVEFTMGTGFTVGSFSWNFGDSTALDTANLNPIHTYNNYGPYFVQLIVTDLNGCTDTMVKSINIIFNGIMEYDGSLAIQVFPNPVLIGNDLHFDMKLLPVVHIVIHDLKGVKVFATTASSGRVSTSGWSKGIYFIKAITKQDRVVTGKVVVF